MWTRNQNRNSSGSWIRIIKASSQKESRRASKLSLMKFKRSPFTMPPCWLSRSAFGNRSSKNWFKRRAELICPQNGRALRRSDEVHLDKSNPIGLEQTEKVGMIQERVPVADRHRGHRCGRAKESEIV